MRILFIHNYYREKGGEDHVFSAESRLMKNYGHYVMRFTVQNNQIAKLSRLALARFTIWNSEIHRKLRKVIQQVKPDIMHAHNTLPLISPAAYYAAKSEGVAVVQTLHNYRLLCPNALLFRNGHICEDCMGKFVFWPGILNACYRENRAATSVTAAMLAAHRVLHTYRRVVDIYIALTHFSRQKFIQGGLPAGKIVVKPNFIDPDPGVGNGQGDYAIFVARLTQEKGIDTLLSAWEKIGGKIQLKVIGDGPLASQLSEASRSIFGVEWLGHKPRKFVLNLMKDAIVLIFPSVCYEGFGLTISEAFSVGLPVIASKLGVMSSMIEHRRTGLHFQPGDPEDLAKKMNWIISHPAELKRMRKAARAEYESKYTAELNYKMLIDIYETAKSRSMK